MKTPTAGLIAVLSVAALLAAGCGSSKSSSSTSAASAYPTEGEKSTSTAAATTTPATTASAGVAVTAKHASKLGTIVAAGPKKMTVYMFEGDHGASSSCTGACVSVWPPVTSTGAATAAGAANSADLGTITRSDGTTQVIYKGHPLYFFAKDKDSGDAYGQGVKGFGADWYVLSPSGSKVDES